VGALLGVHLTLMIGPTAPVPAPVPLIEALKRTEVTFSDEGHSGFELTFQAGRSGPADLVDYALLQSPLLKPFNRVILIVTFSVTPRVLMDGIITRQELKPGEQPGTSTLTVKGEDVSVMMDRQERSAEHPALPEPAIVLKILATYAQFGLVPMVIPPTSLDAPLPIERTPVQQQTDLEFIRSLAAKNGYVFYITPGPVPFTNTAYWGPPVRVGLPQHAITVNMGPETNASFKEFHNSALTPTTVTGRIQDRQSNQTIPVQAMTSMRPPLAALPSLVENQGKVRETQFRETGLTSVQAMTRAQGITEASSDSVSVDGELDAARYGDLLQPRGLVGVRGAGWAHDGFYYVKRVSHVVEAGKYTQKFTLTREGTGSTTPVVVP
jgi:hypothetical protein